MAEAYTIDALRTPTGKRGGGLSTIHSADLGAHVLKALVDRTGIDAGAVEEVFVNVNPQSTLKLGQARGVAMLSLARAGMPVAEYPTKVVKKALVGTGGADKKQIQAMLKVLLPGVKLAGEDASDALAVAITHANMLGSHR